MAVEREEAAAPLAFLLPLGGAPDAVEVAAVPLRAGANVLGRAQLREAGVAQAFLPCLSRKHVSIELAAGPPTGATLRALASLQKSKGLVRVDEAVCPFDAPVPCPVGAVITLLKGASEGLGDAVQHDLQFTLVLADDPRVHVAPTSSSSTSSSSSSDTAPGGPPSPTVTLGAAAFATHPPATPNGGHGRPAPAEGNERAAKRARTAAPCTASGSGNGGGGGKDLTTDGAAEMAVFNQTMAILDEAVGGTDEDLGADDDPLLHAPTHPPTAPAPTLGLADGEPAAAATTSMETEVEAGGGAVPDQAGGAGSSVSSAPAPQPAPPPPPPPAPQLELEDDLCCSICQELLVQTRVLKCGHSFCRQCIEGWAKQQNKAPSKAQVACPMCNELSNGAAMPNRLVDSMIEKLVAQGQFTPDTAEHWRSRVAEYAPAGPKSGPKAAPVGTIDVDNAASGGVVVDVDAAPSAKRRRKRKKGHAASPLVVDGVIDLAFD